MEPSRHTSRGLPILMGELLNGLQTLPDEPSKEQTAVSLRRIFGINDELGRLVRQRRDVGEGKTDYVELQLALNAVTVAVKKGKKSEVLSAILMAQEAMERMKGKRFVSRNARKV